MSKTVPRSVRKPRNQATITVAVVFASGFRCRLKCKVTDAAATAFWRQVTRDHEKAEVK